jgi:hypothetical protein
MAKGARLNQSRDGADDRRIKGKQDHGGSPRAKDGHAPQRKAPPPSDQLLAYLAEYDLRVGELALALREVVLNEAPEANETVFRGYVVSTGYSFTSKWTEGFCHIAVYPRHVNLGFNRGAELADPKGLLIGSGKIIRHLKVAEPDDLKKPHLRRFIRAAIKHSQIDYKVEYGKKSSPRGLPSGTMAAGKRRRSN